VQAVWPWWPALAPGETTSTVSCPPVLAADMVAVQQGRLHAGHVSPRTCDGGALTGMPTPAGRWPSPGIPQVAGGRCQAAHGGLKAPIWVMIAATSSAAHSSLILPSVTR